MLEHFEQHLHVTTIPAVLDHLPVDIQGLYARGTPQQVRAHIDALVGAFGASDGGFILAPAHYLQSDAPSENILTAYEHVKQYR